MDQTRFTTVASGDAIIRQLYASGDPTNPMENPFPLELIVQMRYTDSVEDGKMTLLVDGITEPVFEHPNGDRIFKTRARIEPEGESFQVTITPLIGVSHIQGACVVVSTEMERIILEYLERQDKVS